MTNPAEAAKNALHSFVQLWVESLSLVLAQISGRPFPMMLGEVPSEASPSDDVHLTITTGGPLRGELDLHIPAASALALAKLFLGDTEAAGALNDDSRAALEELFRQVAGYVATSAKPNWPDLTLTIALGQAPTWPAAVSQWIWSAEAAPQLAIEFNLSAALSAALTAVPQETNAATSNAEQAIGNLTGAGTLDFFMDLELGVTLRFGGRDVLLKDVLDLGPGSVLELDREIQEPADLLLDGKLIARGEVVLVNGNYGLRVKEVFTGTQGQA